ncbi:MAG: DEAD/DEAH box helicase [Pseudomonadota bacterium]
MNELPLLPNYQEIKEHLESERKTLLKVDAFSEEDDDMARPLLDAVMILDFLQTLQTDLWNFFQKNPSLLSIFENTYGSLKQFFLRDNIIDLCFLDTYLFPERELFPFEQDGKLDQSLISSCRQFFQDWAQEKEQKHIQSQSQIKEKFTLELRENTLICNCFACLGDFRTKIREFVYQQCLQTIEKGKEALSLAIPAGIQKSSDCFYDIQRDLDREFYRVRHRLKKSTLNKLEGQVKHKVRELFTYPSDLARRHTEQNIRPFLEEQLLRQNVKRDLIDDTEYQRYFAQLSTNVWRNDRYQEREFEKIVKSILMLKRKDISSTILREYLGEFWIHSNARILKRKIIYHMGPTNSGKTYYAIEALCKVKKGCYLAPLRLLAAELYDTMNGKGVSTTLLTGEEIIEIAGSTHISSTVEMARFHEEFDCCVIDEIQMISDPQRGWAWTRALVNMMCPEVHICGDHTVLDLVKEIVKLCGDTLEIKEYERMTKLVLEDRPLILGEMQRSDALITFSRRNALKYKMSLEQVGFKVSIVYGRLSPEVRREQARKFDQGETDIIVATDAIAMGMNLPICRIVFSTLTKVVDEKEFEISPSEIKQIAGRCGRYKRFPIGYVNCLTRVEGGLSHIQEALAYELPQKTQCMVGPDLDIFSQVNNALKTNGLTVLKLSEFLRLFNTMLFQRPFFCVDLKEMIEVTEMVEEANCNNTLNDGEVFGFACAPVNLGLPEHVHYYVSILNRYAAKSQIHNELIEYNSDDIDYLETSIKCIELFQWLARHFNNNNFDFNQTELLENKGKAIEKLNLLLSDKIVPTCASCGKKLEENAKFSICEECFRAKRFRPRGRRGPTGGRNSNNGQAGAGGARAHSGEQGGRRPGHHSANTQGHSGGAFSRRKKKFNQK